MKTAPDIKYYIPSTPSSQHVSSWRWLARASSILGRMRQKVFASSLNRENVEYVQSKQLGSIVVSRRLSWSISEVINSHPHASNCLLLITNFSGLGSLLYQKPPQTEFSLHKTFAQFSHSKDNLIKYLHLIIRSYAMRKFLMLVINRIKSELATVVPTIHYDDERSNYRSSTHEIDIANHRLCVV